jgi:hypothetical protein
MNLRGILKELRRRSVFKVAVADVATGVVLFEALTQRPESPRISPGSRGRPGCWRSRYAAAPSRTCSA